ncbi:hypothetical protein H632_c339p0 [Helicosporidium sp. ATCC 50920]|nr:hypothetical protein H632_c339p0 [Helicosporidium sp. ATCC 50920]|eukprot:KDD76140.1 hypothetical protein H632_c339p0 [Helicosporidium sp. ATCC 50920]
MLHNSVGDAEAALPLYCQALAVWERALGPGAPEVAHALTDVAVIHLERGEDAAGAALLARALDIQTDVLGPEHSEVLAIKEVLEEVRAGGVA